jgi:hypothetical protein
MADRSDRALSGMNRRRPLECWDRGFESHSRHGCLRAFILSLCLFCVQVAALRRADPRSKESYRLCIDQETEKAAKVHKGCRAIDR